MSASFLCLYCSFFELLRKRTGDGYGSCTKVGEAPLLKGSTGFVDKGVRPKYYSLLVCNPTGRSFSELLLLQFESTARFGMELRYHVTLVKDATAAFSREAMYAAHEINGPTSAHAILTTQELINLL